MFFKSAINHALSAIDEIEMEQSCDCRIIFEWKAST